MAEDFAATPIAESKVKRLFPHLNSTSLRIFQTIQVAKFLLNEEIFQFN